MRGGILMLAAVLALAGCAGPGGVRGEARDPPAYADAAKAYNERLSGLDRLWARATVRLKYRDAEGERRTEQGEGHVQLILPSRLAINVGKVGETYAYLGCDKERFWWMELHEERRAWVGSNDAERIEGDPVPVHPADVIELLGVTPLPAAAAATEWSRDGTLIGVTLTARRGTRKVWMRARNHEPARIELFDEAGALAVSCDLSGSQPIFAPGAAGEPRVFERATIRVEEDGTEIRIAITDPQRTSRRPVEAAFDFDALVDAYNIAEVVPLEEAP